MATKSRKRGKRIGPSGSRKKPARAAKSAKRKASPKSGRAKRAKTPSKSTPANLGSAAKSPPKRLPAWDEVEIDEQRENAGRPETGFLSKSAYADDDLAEEMGEEFVMTATSGEQAAEDLRNQDFPEEQGGPFVVTSGRTEFAYGSDPSNPKDAEPAAFPTANNSLEEEQAGARAEDEDDELEERTT
ncbi:MAG TPA: hypothetical protein VN918_08860 [Myxococcaceae bacterium]|nr:hypothetical protein [Myxococcaceae bacterium]